MLQRRGTTHLLRAASALLLVPLLVGVLDGAPTPEAEAAPRQVAAPAGATAYRPVGPCRLLDTRVARAQPLAARETIRIRVAGACGTPANATVAVLSLTVTEARGAGFVTAYPAGTARHETSNLNYLANGTVANTAVVRLNGGAVDIYVHAPTELVVDVMGAFVPAGGAVSVGRFVPTEPRRLLDTRQTGQRGSGSVTIPLPRGVPADATAVAVTVTLVDAARTGFVTVHRAGGPRPLASVQNADFVDHTRAITAIVPVSGRGFTVHRSVVADVVVDFGGWFTGASAAPGTDGLFVPAGPVRIRDSRATFDPVHRNGTITVDVPAAATPFSAAIVNLTAVDTVAPAFLTAHPAARPRPTASNLNPRWRAPAANLAILAVSARGGAGAFSVYANRGAHVVVDLAGRFTGPPPASDGTSDLPGSTLNAMPSEGGRVLFVSDSAFAGIRWLGRLDWLQGATFRADLESCRRLIGASCRGREGYAPNTAIEAIASAPGAYDTLVLTAGYNDWAANFPAAVDGVLAAARNKGIARIVWLTYRQDVSYVSPYGASWAGTFAANNNHLRAVVASGLAPEIEIAEWNTTTQGAPTSWFGSDRLHLTADGATGAATYISRKLAFLERRPCPAGLGGATTRGGWCADPDRVIQYDLPPRPA
jgi:hypothetical protein